MGSDGFRHSTSDIRHSAEQPGTLQIADCAFDRPAHAT
jgi:hypothetical protein